MQILQAQSYNELANRLRFKTVYKGKAVLVYLVFFLTYSFCFTAFLLLLDWVKDQPHQFRWEYFVLGWIVAIVFPLPQGKFRGYCIPFAFEKYFIDQALVQDLQALQYIKASATIIDIQIPSKGFFKPQLHTLTLKLDQSDETITDTAVHLNLLFKSIYFTHANYTKFYADTAWIGQKVEVCFLPRSKRIIQLIADTDQYDFQGLTFDFIETIHSRNQLTLKQVPSLFAQELFAIQMIEAIRQENHSWEYEFIITTRFQNKYYIPTNSKGFAKLERILSGQIDFLKYRQFKQNPSIQSQTLYQHKYRKILHTILKYISVQNRALL